MEKIYRLAKIFFQWVTNTLEEQDGVNTFETYLSDSNGGYGFSWLFLVLVIVSLLTAVIFYYGIAQSSSNATKKNYVITSLLGLITMLVLNFVVVFLFCDWSSCFSSGNMWKICAIDVAYYFILFEVWSLLVKGKSKANTIDWISIIFNK